MVRQKEKHDLQHWIDRLGDPDPLVRKVALKKVRGQIDLHPELELPLLALLHDPDAEIRQVAAAELESISRPSANVLTEIARKWAHADVSVSGESSLEATLRNAGALALVVPFLREMLRSDEKGDRWFAARKLGTLGDLAIPAIPELIGVLGDSRDINISETEVRDWAIIALRGLGLAATGPLREALATSSSSVRQAIEELLEHQALEGTPGGEAEPELPGPGETPEATAAALVPLLASSSGKRALEILARLQSLRPGEAALEAGIRAGLAHLSATVRAKAVEWLLTCGEALPDRQALLRVALEDPAAAVRSGAASALAKLGSPSPELLRALERRLMDEETPVRTAALGALAALSPGGKLSLGLLVSGMLEPDNRFRWATRSLIGEQLDEVAAHLGERLRAAGEDCWLPATAAALAELGARGGVELRMACGESEVEVRKVAAEGLGQLSTAEEADLEVLRKLLKDRNATVQDAAARALGKFVGVETVWRLRRTWGDRVRGLIARLFR